MQSFVAHLAQELVADFWLMLPKTWLKCYTSTKPEKHSVMRWKSCLNNLKSFTTKQKWRRLPAAPSVCPYTLLTETKAAECLLMLCPVKAPPMAPTSAQSMQSITHECVIPAISGQQYSRAKSAPLSSTRWLVRAQSMQAYCIHKKILLGRSSA